MLTPFKKSSLRAVICAYLFIGALVPTAVKASVFDKARSGTQFAAERAGMSVEDDVTATSIIGSIINYLLGFLGVVFLILMIYAGFLWMTAGGNQDQVGKARRIITGAVIGMIIVFAAYAISDFVFGQILTATGPT